MYFKVDHVRDFDLFRKVFGDFSLFIVNIIFRCRFLFTLPNDSYNWPTRDQCLLNLIYNKLKLYSLVIYTNLNLGLKWSSG